MEHFIKIREQFVSLLREEPKATCGHGLTAAIGIILFIAFIIAVVATKP